jgi:hypothetical protein
VHSYSIGWRKDSIEVDILDRRCDDQAYESF